MLKRPVKRRHSTNSTIEDLGVGVSAESLAPKQDAMGPNPEFMSFPKRYQTATACNNCRKAKLKCDGKRPTCARCVARDAACTYDVAEEGMTRREYFRRRYDAQEAELLRCSAVLEHMQEGTDNEAANLLARLRLGDSVQQLYDSLGSANMTRTWESGSVASQSGLANADSPENPVKSESNDDQTSPQTEHFRRSGNQT